MEHFISPLSENPENVIPLQTKIRTTKQVPNKTVPKKQRAMFIKIPFCFC